MNQTLNVRHLTSQHTEQLKRKLAYVLLERDLFQMFGSDAIRYLTDDHRRQLARLGHDLGWKNLLKIAVIATMRIYRRWYPCAH